MAFYLYRKSNGGLRQIWMTIAEKERMEKNGRIRLPDGTIGTRDIVAEQRGFVDSPDLWRKPILSDALGVGPDQVDAARQESVKLGVPTDFTEDGRAVLRSREHRRRYAEALGFYDRDGGYGDPQRQRR